MENGCDAGLFEAPRSTPELSYAVRQTGATAGIVITASHNPPHDNGYKVYFDDGAQVVEPHASGIIAKVNAVQSGAYEPVAPSLRGRLETLGADIDEAFMKRMETLVLDRALVGKQRDLRIVFTPIHGTGGKIIKPLLSRFGFQYSTVPEQEIEDGRFPTVKSPNPENAEALSMAIALAEKEKADLVVATDPDADRMGVAIRVASGGMKLLSGNQIGSLMAYYRTRTFFEKGVLTGANAQRAVIIKTFVTTDLQKAIAEKYGLRCVETLTGFKYIGQKLAKYEAALPEAARRDYRKLTEEETRARCVWNIPVSMCSAARRATATAGPISCATRTATARRSCFAKWRRMRNRKESRSRNCSMRFMPGSDFTMRPATRSLSRAQRAREKSRL